MFSYVFIYLFLDDVYIGSTVVVLLSLRARDQLAQVIEATIK